jgi:hypothetical protein
MSFTSTFNSLSTNGWSADNNGVYGPVSQIAGNVGLQVAISQDGTYAIASNPNSNTAGLVKIYTINNSTKLTFQSDVVGNVESGQVVTKFGTSLGLTYNGDRFISGAPLNGLSNSQFGSARIYSRTGTAWSFEQQINPPIANTFFFGNASTINNDGDEIVVGQGGVGGANATTIFTFSRTGTTWSSLASIPRPANSSGGEFSNYISMDGNSTFVAGAPQDSTAGAGAGAAYVFDTSGTQLAQLIASDAANNAGFGVPVAMSNDGNTIVIGTRELEKIYIFKKSGNAWSEVQIIAPTDISANNVFPLDLSVSSNGSHIFASTSYGSAETPGNTFIYCYSDLSNSNNWQFTQKINNSNVSMLGYTIDTNSSGSLLLTSGGTTPPPGSGTPIGNVLLYGQ